MPINASKVVYIPKQSDDEAEHTSDRAAFNSPWRLLAIDCWILFKNLQYVPYALLPLRRLPPLAGVPRQSWWHVGRDYMLTAIISLVELVLIPISCLVLLICSGWFTVLYAVVLTTLIYLFQSVMWGPLILYSQTKLADPKAFPHERWVFINGVAASQRGVQLTLNRLSSTFGRPITGVHNRSWGVPFDIIECILQRSLAYSTNDVRTFFEHLKRQLLNTSVTKVVVIAHSQGGIITALALDKLYLELSAREISKLEIYTFGSAAAHFNDPRLSVEDASDSQSLQSDEESLTLSLHDSTNTLTPLTRISSQPLVSSPQSPSRAATLSDLDTLKAETDRIPRKQKRRLKRVPGIRFIEHYCNQFDLVPRWGVLYSTRDPTQRYAGRVFVNQGASGHLFDQHYLEGMFPVDGEGVLKEGGFLDEGVEMDGKCRRGRGGGEEEGEDGERVVVDGAWRWVLGKGEERERGRTVRDLSRLWRYVGGREV